MEREQTTIRLPAELYCELKKVSEESGLSITSLLIVAIWMSVLKLRY